MIFDLRNDWEYQKALDYLNEHHKKGSVVTLTRKLANRTLSQNNYYHLIVQYFAACYGISKLEAEIDYFMKGCNADIFVREKLNRNGNRIKCLRSTSELDVGEMATAITRFRSYSKSQFDIYIPTREDNEYILYCEQQIESNKAFLNGEYE